MTSAQPCPSSPSRPAFLARAVTVLRPASGGDSLALGPSRSVEAMDSKDGIREFLSHDALDLLASWITTTSHAPLKTEELWTDSP